MGWAGRFAGAAAPRNGLTISIRAISGYQRHQPIAGSDHRPLPFHVRPVAQPAPSRALRGTAGCLSVAVGYREIRHLFHIRAVAVALAACGRVGEADLGRGRSLRSAVRRAPCMGTSPTSRSARHAIWRASVASRRALPSRAAQLA